MSANTPTSSEHATSGSVREGQHPHPVRAVCVCVCVCVEGLLAGGDAVPQAGDSLSCQDAQAGGHWPAEPLVLLNIPLLLGGVSGGAIAAGRRDARGTGLVYGIGRELFGLRNGHPSQWVGPGYREAIAVAAERERKDSWVLCPCRQCLGGLGFPRQHVSGP